MLTRLLTGALALMMCVVLTGKAHAQSETGATAVTLPETLSPETVRDLLAGLSDEQVRSLLLERLDAVAQEQAAARAEESVGIKDVFYHATTGAVGEIILAIKAIPNMFALQAQSIGNFFSQFGFSGFLLFLGLCATAIAAGLAAEWLVNRLTSGWSALNAEDERPETLRATITALLRRLLRDLLGVFVFLAVGRTVAFSVFPTEMVPFAQLILFNLVALPRIVIAFSRFLLAPNRANYRMVNADDKTAKFLNRHIIGFSLLIGFTFAILGFNQLNQVSLADMRLGFWLNLALHLYIVWIAWTARDGLVQMMRGPDGGVSEVEAKVSMAYPYFAIFVSLATWWLVLILASYGEVGLLRSAPHFKTMAVLLLAPALDTMVRGIVRNIMPPMLGEGVVAKRAHHATEVSYVRIGRVIVFGLVVIVIAGFWGMTLGSLASGAVGAQLASGVVEFLITIAIGYMLWELVSVVINRKLAKEMTASGEAPSEEQELGDGGGAGSSRLSTVLPLILLVSRVAIVVLFTLLALSGLGVDTTPLLAGAGIAGLAIGFGAQKLVTDVVSGVFFLVDDAFRVGEYVDVGDVKGTIEKISVRSMQLRHHLGLVHTVPYGDIAKVTNFSRDWVITKLKFTVPFDTDPEKVRKMFKKIGQEVQAMDEFKDDMLQPFKSQGVYNFDDVGMIVRGKFMAKPGTQFMMRKEIYNRVKEAFNEAGIDFARREVRVNIPGLDEHDELTEEDKAKITATAAASAQAPDTSADAKK